MKRHASAGRRPSRRTIDSRTRAAAHAKSGLRTGGQHCPVCLAALPRIGAAMSRSCGACGARPLPGERCAKCSSDSLWAVGVRAACQGCGHSGSRVLLVAGDVARGDDKRRLFVVLRARGPAYDRGRPLEQQPDWPEHAAFMERLVADDVVRLGGPLDDNGDALLVVWARDEEEVRSRLAADPWTRSGLLEIVRCAPWTVRLGSFSAEED